MQKMLELAMEDDFDVAWLDQGTVKQQEKDKGTPGLFLNGNTLKFTK